MISKRNKRQEYIVVEDDGNKYRYVVTDKFCLIEQIPDHIADFLLAQK